MKKQMKRKRDIRNPQVRKRKDLPNSMKRWNLNEDLLVMYRPFRWSDGEISNILGRSEHAVTCRRTILVNALRDKKQLR